MLGRQRHAQRNGHPGHSGEGAKETLAEGDQTRELEQDGGWGAHGNICRARGVLDTAALKDGHSEESVVLLKDSFKKLLMYQMSY